MDPPIDDEANPRAAQAFLTVTSADGSTDTVTVGPPGAGERLAVGSLNYRSSMWRMTAPKSKSGKSDVFVTCGGLGTAQKFSLHESDVWRNAWHSEELARQHGFPGKEEHGGDPRVLDRWRRPEGVKGWSRALSVWVPYGHLSPLPDEIENPRKPVTWVPEPQPGEVVGLHFTMVKPDLGELNLAGTPPIAGFHLPNGQAALVLLSRAAVDEHVLREHERQAAAAVAGVLGPPPYGADMRIGVFGHHEEQGYRFVWDLSVQASIERASQGGTAEAVERS